MGGDVDLATIIPVIPQTGSGTRNDFLADLKAANGGVARDARRNPNPPTAEEHDPTGITSVELTGQCDRTALRPAATP